MSFSGSDERLDRKEARGRPRDPLVDERVLRATRELLAENGYSKLTVDGVARRAGVTRATVYRRWSSKVELAHEAAFPPADAVPLLDGDDLAGNIRLLVGLAAASYGSPVARAATPGLLADLLQDPDLRGRLRDPMRRAAKQRFADMITAARSRGQVRPEIDPGAAFDALVGAVFFRFAHGEVPTDSDLDAIAAVVLHGLAPHPR